MRMNEGEYHSNPAVSFHSLKDFEEFGADYYKRSFLDREIKRPTTPAMTIGSAFHSLTLEGPEALEAGFIVEPEGVESADRKLAQTADEDVHLIPEKPNRRTKEGKGVWAEIEEAADGREIVLQEDWDRTRKLAEIYADKRKRLTAEQMALVHDMADAVAESPDCLAMLDGCTVEDSWFAEINVPLLSGDYALEVRGRLDAWKIVDGILYIIDAKSTTDLGGFRYDVQRYAIYRQLAFYAQLAALREMEFYDVRAVLIVVEKGKDGRKSRAQLVTLHSEYMRLGHIENQPVLRDLAACYVEDNWPRNPSGAVELYPAKYQLKEDDSHDYD